MRNPVRALPPLAGANGISLAPVMRGNAGTGRRAAWVETLATQLDLGWSPLLGVRTATHKYVRAPEPELYDLAADPHELVNSASAEPALASASRQPAPASPRAAARAPAVSPQTAAT